MKQKLPVEGERAVVKIKRIEAYGAVADLLEYTNVEGFIHVSQVTNSWVKNIRNFISEGNVRVAQVMKVDPAKNEVDLSLRKISTIQEKKKLAEWKRDRRADKLFDKFSEPLKQPKEELYEQVAEPLIEEFGGLLNAFEEIKSDREKLKKFKFSKKINDELFDFIDKNILAANVILHADINLSLDTGDAIDAIKDILKDTAKKGVKIEYLSAPRYRLIASASDYPTAEGILQKAADFAIHSINKLGGDGSLDAIGK